MEQSPRTKTAAMVFSALQPQNAASLLSQLSVPNAQKLLAAAAQPEVLNAQLSDLQSAHRALQAAFADQPQTSSEPSDQLEFLKTLTDAQMKRLLRFVNTSHWAPALKNANKAIVAKVFVNVAPTVATIIRAEIESCDPQDLAAIQSATDDIVLAAKKLRLLPALPTPPKRKAS